MEDKIVGRNPVMEAIRSEREIDKILVKKGAFEGSIVPIIKKAKDKGIIVQEVEKQKLDKTDKLSFEKYVCEEVANNNILPF